VVTSIGGDVVAIGVNDVPRSGGGLCWPGESDQRDHVVGYDTNERRRTEIVTELIDSLRPEGESPEEWRQRGWSAVKAKGAAVLDITEYGRAVHAEMEALLSCARTGISTQGGTLYTTTFPCHNCAKHVIASGIRRVVYVEPYPKSQAIDFYGKMIEIVEGAAARKRGGTNQSSTGSLDAPPKVQFEPFVGVGPRRFFDLFSVGLSSGQSVKRKADGGTKRLWDPLTGAVRVPLFPNSYLTRETTASELLSKVRQQEENHEQEEP
jgi:deoxycytidylate deaminase